ncbi:MAG: hypothetical protein M1160_00290 [Candidatus Marsarchaeota archaeon]|jgi:hypothetical protein|nr:hypothetical protein [Candidatus Marsarchaeota archaeon]MCL5111310.1 hypothetical protein [Candidatus Marsarchaeota archaeon]
MAESTISVKKTDYKALFDSTISKIEGSQLLKDSPIIIERLSQIKADREFFSRWSKILDTIKVAGDYEPYGWVEDTNRGIGYFGKEIDVGEDKPGDRHKHDTTILAKLMFTAGIVWGGEAANRYFDALESILNEVPREPYVEHDDYRDMLYRKGMHGLSVAVSFIELTHILANINKKNALRLLEEIGNENMRRIIVTVRRDADWVYSDRGRAAADAFLDRFFMEPTLEMVKNGLVDEHSPLYKILRSPVKQKRIVVMDHAIENRAVLALFDLAKVCGANKGYLTVVMRQVDEVLEMQLVNLPIFIAYIEAFKAELLTDEASKQLENFSDYYDARGLLKYYSDRALITVNTKLYAVLSRRGDKLS